MVRREAPAPPAANPLHPSGCRCVKSTTTTQTTVTTVTTTTVTTTTPETTSTLTTLTTVTTTSTVTESTTSSSTSSTSTQTFYGITISLVSTSGGVPYTFTSASADAVAAVVDAAKTLQGVTGVRACRSKALSCESPPLGNTMTLQVRSITNDNSTGGLTMSCHYTAQSSPFQKGANNLDFRCVVRCWVQNTSRIQELKSVPPPPGVMYG